MKTQFQRKLIKNELAIEIKITKFELNHEAQNICKTYEITENVHTTLAHQNEHQILKTYGKQ